MRRKEFRVTDALEIDRILCSATVGRLATNGLDGYPYVTPVNYVYHEGNIYFHSARTGEKLDNIARDEKVCFEVDIPLAYLGIGSDLHGRICKLHQFYHCVIVRGTARIISDGELKLKALNALVARQEGDGDSERITDDVPGYKPCVVVEVKPQSISAKSDLGQNRTEEERLAIAKYLKARNRPRDYDVIEAMGFDPDAI